MKTGLLGRKLGHSYSPQIHAYLADYSYELFERDQPAIESIKRAAAGGSIIPTYTVYTGNYGEENKEEEEKPENVEKRKKAAPKKKKLE